MAQCQVGRREYSVRGEEWGVWEEGVVYIWDLRERVNKLKGE